MNVLALEFRSSIQSEELDQKLHANDLGAKSTDETDRRGGGATSREQVVHDQDSLTACGRILVNLEAVRAVLEGIRSLACVRRQLAGLQAIRDCRSEDKATALDSDDDVDRRPDMRRGHGVNRQLKTGPALQERRHVVEQDARLRKVRHMSNLLLERFHHTSRPCRYLTVKLPPRPYGVSSLVSTTSTRAIAGPRASFNAKRSRASASPSASTSTRPSGRFRTQPDIPSTSAASWVKYRNPTP